MAQIHQERYAYLSHNKFGTWRTIDWEALQLHELRTEVELLLNVGSWRQVLTTNEPIYREPTLKLLSIFKRILCDEHRDKAHAISFILGGQVYQLSYTEFIMTLDLYTPDFTSIEEYHRLTCFYPPGDPMHIRWW